MYHKNQSKDSRLNHGIQNSLSSEQKLPNLKHKREKSLERNNSVFSRRELIKKEYNKIIETRLPNILSLMNNEKYNATSVAELSINESNLDYDDTDLLSKMFNKDHNRSGVLNINHNDM